jgi:hypothetical protein
MRCDGCGNADPRMLTRYVHRSRNGVRCMRCIDLTEAVAR